MWMTILYAAGASLPLLAGAIVGVRWQPPQRLVASVLAFAAGALIVSTSFELFEPAYEGGGAWRAALSFGAGALVFVVADTWLDRRTSGSSAGLALLAGVTLDGIPENTALGVSLNSTASLALLVAVFVSNFPEALAGARGMLGNDLAAARGSSSVCGAAPRFSWPPPCSRAGTSSSAQTPPRWHTPSPSPVARCWPPSSTPSLRRPSARAVRPSHWPAPPAL